LGLSQCNRSANEQQGQPSRKRRRKQRRNQFIDVEAEVDEEDEEEPEEDDDLPGDEMHPDDLQELPEGADRDDRKHRELDRQRDQQMHMDAEEEAARLKERYGRQGRAGGGGSSLTDQRLLMPSIEDPRIWRLKCRPGKEREIVVNITHRIFERANTRDPVRIISAFFREGAMSGNLYVEARRQEDITPALENITHIFFGTKPMMLPLEEMPDLLRLKKTRQLEPGMYVRMKRGLYAGDLGQIDDVEANNVNMTVKLVPRLDYGLTEDANAAPGTDGKRKRPVAQNRPPPRLFSETEARKRQGRYLQRHQGLSNNAYTFQGKDYVDGFLISTEKISNLMTDNVNPTLEEVTKFTASTAEGGEGLDLTALAATLKSNSGAVFQPGDHVELFRGEQKGVGGRAVKVYSDLVTIRVMEGPLRGQHIEAPVQDLRKKFQEGDHVKVIGGSKFQDEVGMVVRIRDDKVTILTDSNQQEIIVFSKDLREASDSGGTIGTTPYSLFDLVQIDASTVGCVVKVDRESVRVLDQNGSVRQMLPSNISTRIERRQNAIATDRDGNEIKADDQIKEFGGEQKVGHVMHLHRNFVFSRNREHQENAGVWVARSANIITVAAKGGRSNQPGGDLSGMNPAMKKGGPGGGMPAMPPPVQKGRDRLIGKTVRVKLGPQKGMIGIVKDCTAEIATVELHAKKNKAFISRDKLNIVDPNTGATIGDGKSSGGGMRPPGMPPGAMRSGGQTPARSFGGPPAGARTPSYAVGGGSRTPAWKQDAGSRTPAYGSGTTYGGSGGFGGATSYGGQTSYGGATSYGGGTSYGGAGGAGSAWGGNVSQPVPNTLKVLTLTPHSNQAGTQLVAAHPPISPAAAERPATAEASTPLHQVSTPLPRPAHTATS
jgi:transcription elongation factor SPT5